MPQTSSLIRRQPANPQSAQGLEKLGLAEPNPKVLAEVVHLAEWPTVLEGTFDERFLSLPRRVVETAMESHQRYFPLEGNRFAFVANGGDPETVDRRKRGRPRRTPRRRLLHVRARCRQGHRAARRGVGAHHVRRRRRLLRGQGRAAAGSRRSTGRRRCLPGGCPPRQGRPGRRARPRVSGSRGPHRRRVRTPRRLPGGGLRSNRRAVPARLGRRPAARDGDRPRARRRGQGRQPHRRLRARPAADRVA